MNDALHASAPEGCKCADCQIDQEACPLCYATWWKKKHPNVKGHGPGDEWSQIFIEEKLK